MDFDNLSNRVIGAALEVHKRLGAGLLESAYEAALAYELSEQGIGFQQQVILPIHQAQLMTYMKLSDVKTGLLVNFNTKLLKDGIKRVVL